MIRRAFRDANVLFSAAYRADSPLGELWTLDHVELVTSRYAITEALTNLRDTRQQERLVGLLDAVIVVSDAPEQPLPADTNLPGKDQPILKAAMAAGATHLVTGDVTHFGHWFGKTLGSVIVLAPRAFLAAESS